MAMARTDFGSITFCTLSIPPSPFLFSRMLKIHPIPATCSMFLFLPKMLPLIVDIAGMGGTVNHVKLMGQVAIGTSECSV